MRNLLFMWLFLLNTIKPCPSNGHTNLFVSESDGNSSSSGSVDAEWVLNQEQALAELGSQCFIVEDLVDGQGEASVEGEFASKDNPFVVKILRRKLSCLQKLASCSKWRQILLLPENWSFEYVILDSVVGKIRKDLLRKCNGGGKEEQQLIHEICAVVLKARDVCLNEYRECWKNDRLKYLYSDKCLNNLIKVQRRYFFEMLDMFELPILIKKWIEYKLKHGGYSSLDVVVSQARNLKSKGMWRDILEIPPNAWLTVEVLCSAFHKILFRDSFRRSLNKEYAMLIEVALQSLVTNWATMEAKRNICMMARCAKLD